MKFNTPKILLQPKLLAAAAALSFTAWVGISPVAAQTLVFDYAFEGNLNDSSGNGYNLSLFGSNPALGSAGGRDGVLNLNATAATNPNSAISGPISGPPEALTQFTLAGWIYRPESSADLGGTVISIGNEGERAFAFTIGANGNTGIAGAAGGRSVNTGNSTLLASTGQWVFFAITIDSASASPGTNLNDAVKLYVGNETGDGLTRINNTGVAGSGTVSTFAISAFDSIALGNVYNASLTNAGNVNRALRSDISLDAFRLYDGVLNEFQLNELRLATIPEPQSVALLIGLGLFVIVLARRRRREA